MNQKHGRQCSNGTKIRDKWETSRMSPTNCYPILLLKTISWLKCKEEESRKSGVLCQIEDTGEITETSTA